MNELPAMAGSRFVAASWNGSGAAEARQVAEALQSWHIAQGDGWLLASERADCWARRGGAGVALTVSHILDRGGRRMVCADDIARKIETGGEVDLKSLGAPFRLAWMTGQGVPMVATDSTGLGQVFYASSGGFAVASSSAALLGSVLRAEPDVAAFADFAQFGCFPFEQSPYLGIRKLPPGSRMRLDRGQCLMDGWQNGERESGPLTDVFRSAVDAMLAANPVAKLELSGGLDSRLVLAAMEPAQRRGRLAMTIGSADYRSPDVTIARRISEAEGLDHRVVGLDEADLRNSDMAAALDHTVQGYDCMANPLDKIPLILANRNYNAGGRFSGQNGEILRGFYYPLQPLDASPSASLATRLVNLRVVSNDKADSNVFLNSAQELMAQGRQRMVDDLAGRTGSWASVLDSFYLDYRMQSWAGNGVSNRFIGRAFLVPFFDNAVIAAALALPARAKQDSLAAYRLLADLDPRLAAMPLDSGLVPAAAARQGLSARVGQARMMAAKIRKKLEQKAGLRTAQVLGAGTVAQVWHEQGGHKRLNIEGLSRLGLFTDAFLEGLAAGTARPDRATLGLVLLCNGVVR